MSEQWVKSARRVRPGCFYTGGDGGRHANRFAGPSVLPPSAPSEPRNEACNKSSGRCPCSSGLRGGWRAESGRRVSTGGDIRPAEPLLGPTVGRAVRGRAVDGRIGSMLFMCEKLNDSAVGATTAKRSRFTESCDSHSPAENRCWIAPGALCRFSGALSSLREGD